MPLTLTQITSALNRTSISETERFYLKSYREIMTFVSTFDSLTPNRFFAVAHIVYAWMPTMLELYEPNGGYQIIVNRLNEIKRGDELTSSDLSQLKSVVNNSLVGSTKLLHCLSPERFAIWDRRVCRFIRGTTNNYQVEKPSNYLAYLEDCQEVMRAPGFLEVHQRIDEIIGYPVSGLRALEWVMYMNGLDNRPAA